MQHHFNTDIARKFGIPVAIFLDHMSFWITKNIANNSHFYDGAFWTYNSIKAYTVIFDYFSADQMRKVIKDCEKYGLINTGNYNENKYDRTAWYSLTEYAAKLLNISILQKTQMEVAENLNGSVQNPKPIPCTNTVTNTESTERKKRVPLPDDFKFNEEHKAMCNERKLDHDNVCLKFREWMKSRQIKFSDWDVEAKLWILREKEESKKPNKQRINPVSDNKSTVQWFNENH